MYFKQSENIASAELDNEICIFSPSEGNYLNLNSSASEIWKMLDKSIKMEEIIDKLSNIYNVDKNICRKEVEDFLAKAKKSKLIIESKYK